MSDEISALRLLGFDQREIDVVMQMAREKEIRIGTVLKRAVAVQQLIDAGRATLELRSDSPGCGTVE